MADHGLTGTHHLDGSMCTRTANCPWSAKDYMAKLQGQTMLPTGPSGAFGDVSQVFEAIMNLGPTVISDQDVLDYLARHQVDPITQPAPSAQLVAQHWQVPMAEAMTMVSQATVTLTQQSQGGSLGGMQVPIQAQVMPHPGAAPAAPRKKPVTAPPLGPVVVMPPINTPKGRLVSHNPITNETLRHYWPDADLTDEQRVILDTLDDDMLDQALDEAFLEHTGQYEAIEVAVLAKATNALVASLPNPSHAAEGTQDECLNCGLPITFADGTWGDDILGQVTCSRMQNLTGHQPKDVLAKFRAAMAKAGSPTQSADGPLLFVLTTDGSDREDGNVHYARFLLVDAPEVDRPAIGSRIAHLLDGDHDGHGGVSFTQYNLQTADEAFGSPEEIVKHLASGGWNARVVNNLSMVTQNEA